MSSCNVELHLVLVNGVFALPVLAGCNEAWGAEEGKAPDDPDALPNASKFAKSALEF